MIDFNSFLDSTDEEKKKKATQTPSQQAASDIKKSSGKIDFNSFIDTPKPKPSITTTVTPPPVQKKPSQGFDIGGFFNNLGETIKKSLATAIPQLANKPNIPSPTTTQPPTIPSLNGIKQPTQPIKTLDGLNTQQQPLSATMTPEALQTPQAKWIAQKTTNIVDSVLKYAQNPVDPTVNAALRLIPGVNSSMKLYKPGTEPLDIIKAENEWVRGKLKSVDPKLETVYDYATFLVPGRFEYFMAKEFEAAPKQLDKIWKDEGKTFTEKLQKSAGEVVIPLATYVYAPKVMEKILPKTTLKELEKVLKLSYKEYPLLFNLLARAAGRGVGTMELINASQQMKAGMEAGATKEQIVDNIIKTAPEAGAGGLIFGLSAEAWGIAQPKLFGYQKANEAVMTPEQVKTQVEGTDAAGTKFGEDLTKARIIAEAEGKNIKVSTVAVKEGVATKTFGVEKAQKIADITGSKVITGNTPGGTGYKIEVVDIPSPIQKLGGATTATPKTPEAGIVPVTPKGEVNLEGIKQANPVLFREAQKAQTVEKFITKMEEGKPGSVDKTVLTEFYNKVNAPEVKPVVVKPQEIIPKTELQTTIEKKITEQGGNIQNISKDSQGYTTIQADNVRISFDEKPDTIDIVGFKRGEAGIVGDPTKLIEQIKQYATSQDKSITATKITGGDIEYWKKVGFEPVDVSGGKGIQYEAIWEKPKVQPSNIPQKVESVQKESTNVYKDIESLAIRKNSPQELAYDLARKLNNFSLGDIKLSKDQKIELQQWDNKWGNIITSRGITAVKEVPSWIKDAWNNSQIQTKEVTPEVKKEQPLKIAEQYAPEVPTKVITPKLELLKGETGDMARERIVGYQVDNGVVKIESNEGGLKATILSPTDARPHVIAGMVKKQDLINEVYKYLNPDYGVVEEKKAEVKPVKPPKMTNKKIFSAVGNWRETTPYIGYAVVDNGKMTVASEGFEMVVETKSDLPDGQYKPVGDQLAKMKSLNTEDAITPRVAEKPMGSMAATVLQNISKKLSSIVSKDDTRPVLNGALFEIRNGNLHYTATDGFKMYHDVIPTNLKEGDYILPSIEQLNKVSALLDGQVQFKQDDDILQLISGDTTITMKKVGDKSDFPPYQRVYPTLSRSYQVSTKALSDAIKQLDPFAKLKAKQIGFEPSEKELVLKTQFTNEAGEVVKKQVVIPVTSTPSISTTPNDVLRGSIIMPVYQRESDGIVSDKGFILNSDFVKDILKTQTGDKTFISTVAPDENIKAKPVHISDRNEIDFRPAPVKRAPSGMASSGVADLGAYESRLPESEQEANEVKIFEQVQALIRKYAQTVGEGYTPRGASGVYYGRTKNIRVNGMNNLSVAAHEITHFLDHAFNISEKLRGIVGYTANGKPKYDPVTRKFRKEITDIYLKYYGGAKKTHSLYKRTVEGFATLLQKYVEMPRQITAEYPDLVKQFLMPGGDFYHPVMSEIIKDISKFIEEYQALDPLDKIGARVANGQLKTGKQFLNIFDKARTMLEDQVYPIEKLAKKAGVHFTGNDPSLWLRAYSNGGGIYANNILNDKKGYWTLNENGEFAKKYDFNWRTLLDHLKKEKIDNSFGNYLIARDQFFEWQELDKLKEEYRIAAENAKAMPPEDRSAIDSDGKTVIDKLNEARNAYLKQEQYLKNNGFTRTEITEAYQGNKDRFVVESEMYDKLVRADLDMLHNPEIGLVSGTQYENLSKKEGYASMKRQIYDDIMGDDGDKYVGAKSTKASSLKGRTGGEQAIINPVLNGMVNHIEITKKAMRQAIYNKIGKIAQEGKLPELFQTVQLRSFIDDQGRMIFPQEKDPNIIMARINGKRVPFIVDKTIKKTVDDVLTYQAMNLFENGLVNMSRLFTIGTTGAYAPFALTNVLVDQWSAVQNTRNNYTPILDITKAIGKALANKGGEESTYYNEWQILGGDRMTLFQSQMQTMEEAVKYVTQETNKLEKVQLLLEKGIDVLSLPSKYSETMSRFTEYYKARKAGKNQLVALEEAGRVTAPFHHIGSWKVGDMPSMKYMIRSIPFGNAALQVLAQTIRTAETPNGRKRIAFLLGAMIAAYLSSMYAIMQFSSKDQKEQYKDLTPTDIATYLHYPAIGGNGLVRIKIPSELSTLAAVMNMVIADNLLGTKYTVEDYKDALTNWIPRQINIFSPIEMFFSWLPPALKIPIELLANFKDFPRVKPLESQGMLYKEPGQRYNEATSPLAKLIGEKFNISPIKTDYLIEGFLGRASRYVTGKKGSTDLTSGAYREYFFSMGRRVQDFYDESTAINQRWNTLKTQYKGKPNLSAEIKKEISTVNQKRLFYNRINDMLGELRKIDIKKDPKKAAEYRDRIIQGFEQLDKMK